MISLTNNSLSPPLSTGEIDVLTRTNKSLSSYSLTSDMHMSNMQPPSLPSSTAHTHTTSYKDKLIENQSHNYFTIHSSSINEADLIDEVDNTHIIYLSFPLPQKIKKEFINDGLLPLSLNLWKNIWLQIFTRQITKKLETNERP